MSLGIKPEKTYLALDQRIDSDSPIAGYYVEKGGAKVSYEVIDASTTNSSTIQFSTNINPPSPQTYFSRKIPLHFPCTITLTHNGGPSPTGRVYSEGNDGLRAYPVHKCINSMALKLNTQTVAQSPSQYIDALTHFNIGFDLEQLNNSGSAVYHDPFMTYEDTYRFGTYKNPLANWGEGINPRGFGHPSFKIVFEDANTCIIEADLYEYLMISPCKWDRGEQLGFYGIQNMALTINLKANLEKWIWSHNSASGNDISVNVALGNSNYSFAQLLFTYITPDLATLEKIPRSLTYDYNHVERYLKQQAVVLPGASAELRSENIQLGTVPKRIFIFVDRVEDQREIDTTDTYARIDRLEISFDNQTSQIASADTFQLWKMAVKNGSRQSWGDWNLHQGSIACIDFGAGDLGLNSLTATGLLGNFNLKVQCNFTNLDDPLRIVAPRNLQLNVVVVEEGTFVVYRDQLQCFAQTGLVSKKDIIDSNENEQVEVVRDLEGSGNFMNGIKKFIKKGIDLYQDPQTQELIKKYGPDAMRILKKYGPMLAAKVLPLIKGGMAEDMAVMKAQGMAGGDFQNGRGYRGGKLIAPKDRLKNRLINYDF